MRTFYVSLIIFAVLLLVIVGNCIFIHRTAAALAASLSELPKAEDTEGAATAISDFWETRKLWVGLSVPQDTVREMSDRISEVCAKAKRKEEGELELAIHLSLNTVQRLCYTERLSIENLL